MQKDSQKSQAVPQNIFSNAMLKSNFNTKKAQSALYVVLLAAVVALMLSVKRCTSGQHAMHIRGNQISITTSPAGK